jgi:hypothetical protein
VEPLASAVPFMVKVAVGSLVSGCNVTEVMALLTLAVYPVVPLAKAGLKLPLLTIRLDRCSFDDGALITVIV